MAQELLLRSNSSFLRKGSTCVVTRRTLIRQQDGYARRAAIAWATHGLEADQGRDALPVVVADVDGEVYFRGAAAATDRTAEHPGDIPEPASSWHSMPGGTATQRSHTARVRATG